MTEDQILSVARTTGWNVEHEQTNKMLIQLVNQAIQSEREQCAQLCEDHFSSDGDFCAKQIRKRNERV